MNEAQEREIPIVYVSLGSMCKWEKWEVEALYNGLKRHKCKVIWSMKVPELLPSQDDPDFWISSWIPQVEVLAHPALKVGLSHCGFGGTLEFISSGVVLACYPHFGDQGMNTELVVKGGFGLSLIDPSKARGAFR